MVKICLLLLNFLQHFRKSLLRFPYLQHPFIDCLDARLFMSTPSNLACYLLPRCYCVSVQRSPRENRWFANQCFFFRGKEGTQMCACCIHTRSTVWTSGRSSSDVLQGRRIGKYRKNRYEINPPTLASGSEDLQVL